MGQFVRTKEFSDDAFEQFNFRLRKESALLAQWFEAGRFSDQTRKLGLEVEGWLIDAEGHAAAANEQFLRVVDDPLIVPELSRYNFEINTLPLDANGSALSILARQLEATWQKISKAANSIGLRSLMIGSLPSLEEHMLGLESMSGEERYRLLNEQIMRLRRHHPIHLHIEGLEELDITHHDVMLEAASTSVQVHLQVPLSAYCRYYNASILASPFTVAAAANAPFVLGRCLWEETRIPVFERSLALPGFQDCSGYLIQRVNFGSGFLRQSPMSCFLENLDGYPILMPLVEAERDMKELYHLKLHNGTIWRWNRPILGMSSQGEPTIRIEHRVMSAGPSIADTVANVAFFLAVVNYFANRLEDEPELLANFDRTRHNFYQAARYGLEAPYVDAQGREGKLGNFMNSDFFANIKSALRDRDYDEEDIRSYIDEVMRPRITQRKTGAAYQRQLFAECKSYHELVNRYHAKQQSGHPVCHW